MLDYLVLLEEIAGREAEARVVDTRGEWTISVMAVTPVLVPWTGKRWLLTFGRLVGCVATACCVCLLMKMIHVFVFLFCKKGWEEAE